MKVLTTLWLAMGAAAGGAQAWDWSTADDQFAPSPEYASSKSLCRQVRGREPPVADAAPPAVAAGLEGCSSEALYYGIGVKADPVKARQCAFLEMKETSDESHFAGRAMLMTIYANGVGAKRDMDVAIHLACGVEGAPAESHGRVSHLAELKAKGWTGKDFHFCDDITSGYAGGVCAAHEAGIKGAKRESELAAITARWTPAQRQAFERLRKAHAAFAEAHSSGENDLSGTLRGAIAIGAEERLRDDLLDMIKRLEAGRAPRFTAADYRGADAALNSGYRNYLASDAVGGDFPGAVTRQGVLDAQRAWLRYRDAFLAFAATRYPQTPRESIATWITRKRTEMWKPAA